MRPEFNPIKLRKIVKIEQIEHKEPPYIWLRLECGHVKKVPAYSGSGEACCDECPEPKGRRVDLAQLWLVDQMIQLADDEEGWALQQLHDFLTQPEEQK